MRPEDPEETNLSGGESEEERLKSERRTRALGELSVRQRVGGADLRGINFDLLMREDAASVEMYSSISNLEGLTDAQITAVLVTYDQYRGERVDANGRRIGDTSQNTERFIRYLHQMVGRIRARQEVVLEQERREEEKRKTRKE